MEETGLPRAEFGRLVGHLEDFWGVDDPDLIGPQAHRRPARM